MYLYESLSNFFEERKQNHIEKGTFIRRLFLSVLGFSGNDYANYNFRSVHLSKIISEYIPYYRRKRIRGNDHALSAKILSNKYETLKILSVHGLPTSIPKYLVIDSTVFTLDLRFEKQIVASQIKKGDYVIKPTNQRWGKGIEFLAVHEDVSVVECEKIVEAIQSEYNTLLVEKKENNHPELEKLSKSSLNTLRIITLRTKSDGIKSIFACVRFSSNGGTIDNWSSGGFAAYIDLNTGICHAASKKERDASDSLNFLTEGFSIPFFNEAKKLAEQAHAIFPDMKSIGWDIAITPRGAIIIEGNDDWDVILPQKLMQKGIRKQLCKK